MPCGLPPHREVPIADAAIRAEMVRIATRAQEGFVVDDRELKRQGPSYSVDTLSSLRAEFPDRSLCLIVGMDAFLGLPMWHRWRDILQLAHLIVAHRPGWRAPDNGPLGELLSGCATQRPGDFHERKAGRIFVHAVTQLEISSTEIRALIRGGRDPRFLLPDGVREKIMDSACYAPNEATV